MRVAFLTESRADWGGIKPVMLEFIANHAEIELWIVGEHLERGTAEDVLYEIRENFRDSISKVKFATKPEEISESKAKWLFVLGDRKNVFPFVISAWEKGIKIAHISGGDFQIARIIDEKIRWCVSEFADIHFPSTKKSYNRLEMRFPIGTRLIKNVGSPYVDGITDVEKYFLSFAKALKKKPIVIQMHYGDSDSVSELAQIFETIGSTVKKTNKDSDAGNEIFAFSPNKDNEEFYRAFHELAGSERNKGTPISVIENLPRASFLKLLLDSRFFIGNSSAIFLEAQYIGVPCVHVGTRNLGREEAFPGHCVHWDIKSDVPVSHAIFEACRREARTKEADRFRIRENWENGAHGDGTASQKIVEEIYAYKSNM